MNHLTTTFAFCAALLATACYGDMVSTWSDPGAPADPGGEPGVDGPDAAPISGDAGLTCVDPQTSPGDGHHNPGLACASCHDGSIGPRFSVAGTLYADPGGATPVAGATITLVGADGSRIDLATADNGNFWTDRAIEFPVTTYASSCPDLAAMATKAGSGDCNGCHTAGDAITFAP